MESRRGDPFGSGSTLHPVSGPSNPLPRHPGLGQEATGESPAPDSHAATPPEASSEPGRFGLLRDVDPRELWLAGEGELLAWLGQNPEPLAAATGLALRPLAGGATAPVDCLVLETDAGDRVVVVVDLGESSDKTLGRLMRTVAATGATTSIWLASAPRNEHLASMSWLNRTVTERSFILQLRGVRIDDSRPAPLFGAILRPPRHDDLPGGEPAAGPSATFGRRADDWPSVTLIERGVDGTG
jgi:hypothetical protein